MTIQRLAVMARLQDAVARSPVTVLTGPRQSGKTTLARELLPRDALNYFDLEDPISLARLEEPRTALDPLRGLVVIDEVQRRPDLFPLLRVLADRPGVPAHFLLLGSASGALMHQSAESLAGRVDTVEIGGFTLDEVGAEAMTSLWVRGGFPRSWTARSDVASLAWRRGFTQTLLERDLPQWGVRVPAVALRRFWVMLAHYHAQTWNSTDPARALGVAPLTCRRYLDVLTDALMIRQLQPWHANVRKRQVKAPKVYLRDTGLLHHLLGIDGERALLSHPKVGASWEGFVIEQLLLTVPHDDAWFWATHQGAEIDLVLRRGDQLIGIECKRSDAPRLTPSIRHALADVGLARVLVIYPGATRYPLDDRVEAVPLSALATPATVLD